ncbi:TGS domain-containing protein [candidate division KSB1 bacterium]|nr:50S ribosome-binding GTPase [candidate division KSB1 bacterium]RQW00041.1 MAG: TGS domain-containing protein [candidate division KSB1 bacterium]
MPANLSPEYYRAEEEFKKAQTAHDRLKALKGMLAAIPKHKGTEKMQADLKRRISQTNEEIQKSGRKKGFSITVDREGGGQVCFAGPPNSGKSRLIATLTETELEVADYPFTTRIPHPVMMKYEDIQIQLVDLPPVCSQHMEYWVPNILRTCDLILVVFDLADDDVLEALDDTLRVIEEHKIELVPFKPDDESWASIMKRRAWLVGTKIDLPTARENWQVIKEFYANQFGMSAVSSKTRGEIERLREEIVMALEIVRVYTKKPGQSADKGQPYIVPRGSTLLDFAKTVHKDFAANLKFARVWGQTKYDGMMVNRDYILQDRDVVELHI